MVNLMSLKAFTSLRRIVKCSICVSTFYQISIDSFNTTLFIDSYLLLKSFTLIFLFDFFLRWLSKDRHLASNFLKHLNLSWSALRDLRRLRFIVTIPYPERINNMKRPVYYIIIPRCFGHPILSPILLIVLLPVLHLHYNRSYLTHWTNLHHHRCFVVMPLLKRTSEHIRKLFSCTLRAWKLVIQKKS